MAVSTVDDPGEAAADAEQYAVTAAALERNALAGVLDRLPDGVAVGHAVLHVLSQRAALLRAQQEETGDEVVRYRNRTPAMAAGLTRRRFAVKELLLLPLPAGD